MFFLYILPPVVLVVVYVFASLENGDWLDWDEIAFAFRAALITLFVGAVIALIGGAFYTEVSLTDDDFTKTTEVKHLAAFTDHVGAVNGSFFLGSGSIGSTAYYYYYEVLPNGGKRFGKTNAEDQYVEIHETDRTNGELHVRHWDYEGHLGFWLKTKDRHMVVAQTFYVPRGTVLNKFSADLQ